MQKDMHYYGTYAMARAAGLSSAACQIIATAAEFVDDNAEKRTVEFGDGGRLDFVPTAHHTKSHKNLDRHDQRHVWVPFHFLPGNEGETVSERLVCQKDSAVAQEMVRQNVARGGTEYGLYLAGITAHVYGDTFSHYGFSGVSSRWNRVDAESVKLHHLNADAKRHVARQAEKFRRKYGEEMGALENFRRIMGKVKDTVTSNLAETLSGALGHGAALTYPDRPYLRWEFEYEGPERRHSGLRDNRATFLEGCEKLHRMFRRVAEVRPDAVGDQGRPFNEIEAVVTEILETQAPREGREDAWQTAASEGRLFGQSEEIAPYRGEEWLEETKQMNSETRSGDVLQSHVFRFYQAAAIHRTYVLRELLPNHGLAVD